MGYTTEFYGSFGVEPALNLAEIDYLNRFASSRRMSRSKGPYYANPGTDGFGQDREDDILNYNEPPKGQPGLWCQWVPSEDGTEIKWDEGEKFYEAEQWIKYLINEFLAPHALAQRSPAYVKLAGEVDAFSLFTFDHVVNGEVEAQGEDPDDRWLLIVEDNVVKVATSEVRYSESREV